MPRAAPSPVPSKPINLSSQQTSNRYRDAVSQGVRLKVHQLIQAGILRPARPTKQCSGNWKPRMDLIDDPSSPNIIAIFELPGVKNENITLQIKDRRLVIIGTRVDPFTEALAAARGSTEQVSTPTDSGGVDSNFVPRTPANPQKISTGGSVTPSNTSSSTNKSVRELRYGSFFRSIPIPEGIKQSEVSAGIQDGMLTVTWPRVLAARSPTSEVTPTSGATDTTTNVVDPTSVTHPSVPTEVAPMLQ